MATALDPTMLAGMRWIVIRRWCVVALAVVALVTMSACSRNHIGAQAGMRSPGMTTPVGNYQMHRDNGEYLQHMPTATSWPWAPVDPR